MKLHTNKIINAIAYVVTILILIGMFLALSVFDIVGHLFTLVIAVPVLLISFVIYSVVKIAKSFIGNQ